MPRPKHHEPLVKKMVVVAERQWEALETCAEQRPGSNVSQFVREALDYYLDHPAATLLHEHPDPERATA